MAKSRLGQPGPPLTYYNDAVSRDVVRDEEAAQRARSTVWGSVAFVGSLTLAIFCAIRILLAANGDVQIAYAIISTSTVPVLGLAALVTILPAAIPPLAIEATRMALQDREKTVRLWSGLVAFLSLGLSAYVSSRLGFIAAASLSGLWVVLDIATRVKKRYGRSSTPRTDGAMPQSQWSKLTPPDDRELRAIFEKLREIPEDRFPSRYFAQRRANLLGLYTDRWVQIERLQHKRSLRLGRSAHTVASGLLGLALLSSPFWLPAERITTSTGAAVEVAYVLRQDASWTTLLLDSPRQLRVVRSPEIRTREVCDLQTLGILKPVLSIAGKKRGSLKPCLEPPATAQAPLPAVTVAPGPPQPTTNPIAPNPPR